MAKKENQEEKLDNEMQHVQEALTRSEQFIEKNQKVIIIAFIAIVVIVGGFFGVKHGYLLPREKKAQAALFSAEQAFIQQNYQLALDGDGAALGFKAVADDYSFTKSANLANAYAGLCLVKLEKYSEAIDYLKKFDGSDILIAPAVTGAIGDCLVETDQVKEASSYFEKAAKMADNEMLSPIYLMKAGVAYETLGDYKSAAKVYKEVKEKYYLSQEAADIDKYIERAETLASK